MDRIKGVKVVFIVFLILFFITMPFPYYFYNWGSHPIHYYRYETHRPIEMHYGFEVLLFGGFIGMGCIIASIILLSSYRVKMALISSIIGVVSIMINLLLVVIVVLYTRHCYFAGGFYAASVFWTVFCILTLILINYWNFEYKSEKVEEVKMKTQQRKEVSNMRYCNLCKQYVTPVKKKKSVGTIILLLCLSLFCFGLGLLLVYLLSGKKNTCPLCKQKQYLRRVSLTEWENYKQFATASAPPTRILTQEQKNLICPQCGSENYENDKFCRVCGTKILKEVVCPDCGTEMEIGMKFCPYCGKESIITDFDNNHNDIIE